MLIRKDIYMSSFRGGVQVLSVVMGGVAEWRRDGSSQR